GSARRARRARSSPRRAAALGRGRTDRDRSRPPSLGGQRPAPPGRRGRRILKRSVAMRFSPRVDRLAGHGADAWSVHLVARRRQQAGEDIIFLTVGDPDQEPPEAVIEATVTALRQHRTGYAPIVGFPALREAIAA